MKRDWGSAVNTGKLDSLISSGLSSPNAFTLKGFLGPNFSFGTVHSNNLKNWKIGIVSCQTDSFRVSTWSGHRLEPSAVQDLSFISFCCYASRFLPLHLLRFRPPPAHRNPGTWTAGSIVARLVCCDPRCSACFCSVSPETPELWVAGWRQKTWMGQFQFLPLGGEVTNVRAFKKKNPKIANFLICRPLWTLCLACQREKCLPRKQLLTFFLPKDLVQAVGAGHICEGQTTDSSSHSLLTVCRHSVWKRMGLHVCYFLRSLLRPQQVTHQALFTPSHCHCSTLLWVKRAQCLKILGSLLFHFLPPHQLLNAGVLWNGTDWGFGFLQSFHSHCVFCLDSSSICAVRRWMQRGMGENCSQAFRPQCTMCLAWTVPPRRLFPLRDPSQQLCLFVSCPLSKKKKKRWSKSFLETCFCNTSETLCHSLLMEYISRPNKMSERQWRKRVEHIQQGASRFIE